MVYMVYILSSSSNQAVINLLAYTHTCVVPSQYIVADFTHHLTRYNQNDLI